MFKRRPQHPGATGLVKNVSKLPECLLAKWSCQGGDELGTEHPLLHSADKWAMFLRHRGEGSQSRQASASRDPKAHSMTLEYESDCQAS